MNAYGWTSTSACVTFRCGDLVDERRLANVRVSTYEERVRGGIDGGQTEDVLADLLQELKGLVLALHDCRHPTKGSALELLAAVEAVATLSIWHGPWQPGR